MKDDVKDLDELANELISRVENVLENAEPSPDRDALQTRFEDMKAKWGDVKDKVSARETEIEERAPVLHDYHDNMEDFVAWLTDLDNKISSQSPVSCDPKMIAKQLQQVEALNKDLELHKPEFETVKEISSDVIKRQPDDVYVVEAQLQYVIKMWESVSFRLKDRSDQINNVKDIAEEYQKAQRPVRALYAWAEEAIVPAEAIGSNIERAKQELNNTKVGFHFSISTFFFSAPCLIRKMLKDMRVSWTISKAVRVTLSNSSFTSLATSLQTDFRKCDEQLVTQGFKDQTCSLPILVFHQLSSESISD